LAVVEEAEKFQKLVNEALAIAIVERLNEALGG